MSRSSSCRLSWSPVAVLVLGLALTACRADPVTPPPIAPVTGQGGAGAKGTGGTPAPIDGTGGKPAADANGMPEAPVNGGPPQALGQPCDGTVVCASGFCRDGVCCSSLCDDSCSSCALPGLVGTCVKAPAGEDPRTDCPAESPGTCGRSGGCDGMGRCLRYNLGAECAPLSCRDGIESAPGRCNASGTCQPGEARLCSSNQCNNGRCLQGCSTSAPCPAGFECLNATCVGNGAALHWRFDEESGTLAADASGHAFGGVYLGEGKTPEPSTAVPPTTFANPRSRTFAATGRPAVQLPGISGSLKPPNDITLSIWYRATTAAMGGSDLVSVGADYFFRLKPTDIEFVKRVSNVAGMTFAVARVTLPTHLDGKWHHLAGVTSMTGMRLYVDGVLKNVNARGEVIAYSGNDLWVGRDGSGAAGRDYAGDVDDLRIYTRAMSAEEVAALAAGKP